MGNTNFMPMAWIQKMATNLAAILCVRKLYFKVIMLSEQAESFSDMLICVNVVQECDARDDDSSNAADIIKFYPIAIFKSSIRSSASSIPTLRRINESDRPFLILSSLGIEACVIDAG